MNQPRTNSSLPVDVLTAPASLREGHDTHYQLIKRAELAATEVEDLATRAVEVTVQWERTVLHVTHLTDGDSFALESEAPSLPSPAKVVVPGVALGALAMLAAPLSGAIAAVGAVAAAASVGAGVAMQRKNEDTLGRGSRFVVDRAQLGAARCEVVRRDAEGLRFVFPEGAEGEVELDGDRRSLDTLIVSGIARPSLTVEGAHETVMLPGGRYSLRLGALTVRAKLVAGARAVVGARRRDPMLGGAAVGASLAIAALLGAMHFATQSDGVLSSESEAERLDMLRAFVATQTEHAAERVESTHEAAAANAPSGAAHAGETGAMGRPHTPNTGRRHGIRDNGEPPHVAQQTAREQVTHRGVFAALGAHAPAGGTSGVTSMFGQMTESGHDAQSVAGNLDGDTLGESGGMGGLGRVGTGIGANGNGEGTIGTGRLGTLGSGTCDGADCRYGNTAGTRMRSRASAGIHAVAHNPVVTGVSPDVIRRVVLRNLRQVNHCYEQGLATNPQLAGRVAVRFVIASTGSVLAATVADSNLGLPSVDQCITNAVQRWNFTLPADSGAVTVTYPFSLMPAE